MPSTKIGSAYHNFVTTRRVGTIFRPIDLTSDGDEVVYQKPRSLKEIQRMDLSGPDVIKSNLPPVIVTASKAIRCAKKAFVIPDDDSEDDDNMDFTFDNKSSECLAVVTRSAKKQSTEVYNTLQTTHSVQKEVTVSALAFIASITSNIKKQITSLETLPTEILLNIFASLKKVPACVLSLTCKRFNRIYKDTSPFAVGLNQSSDAQRLYSSLQSWIGDDYKYVKAFGIFVTQGHWARYREEIRVTNKMLRDMETESKKREEKSAILQAKKRVREVRACNIRANEEVVRANRVDHEVRRASKWGLRTRRSRV